MEGRNMKIGKAINLLNLCSTSLLEDAGELRILSLRGDVGTSGVDPAESFGVHR
jgi:hypothetical protein